MSSAFARRTASATAPTVSIVLPTWNRLEYLRPAVDSVFAQTYSDWELIIADDGSEPETLDYLRSVAAHPHVLLMPLAHCGNPSAVRNAALRVAHGRYVAFLDSDDLWLPSKLERQLAALAAEPSRLWNYTAVLRVGPDGAVMPEESARNWTPLEGSILEPLLTLEAAIALPSVVADRNLIERAGNFDEQQMYFEDYDLWMRLNMLSELSMVNERLTLVRNHQMHYTADRVGVYRSRERLLDKFERLDSTARLRAAFRRERARNVLDLAGAHIRAERRLCGLGLLWRGRAHLWRARRWSLRPVGMAMARACSPRWLRALVRKRERARAGIALRAI